MPIDLSKLNKEQREAVEHGSGPLLIVAGAGTGKTTVITQRAAFLINQNKAKPEEILALTFTDKAAQEMEERIDQALAIGYIDLWVSTFHSFAERILREEGLNIGLDIDFKLQDETAAWVLVRQNLDKFNLDYYKPLGQPSQFIHALIKHFSQCKDQVIYPNDYLKYTESLKTNLTDLPEKEEAERQKEVAGAYHLYQKLLLDNNLLDFGDLINYCLNLFEKRPAILKKYQDQFKYILIDEFQDTNWAQYQLIKKLAGSKASLTVVADDFQAIYKFRGASFTNIVQFKKDFPQVKEVSLVKNYRSSQNILDLAYNFIKDNDPSRLKYFPDVEKKLAAQIKEKAKIEHLHFKDLKNEAKGVVKKIIAQKSQDKEAGFGDFALLVRANNSALAFVSALEKASLPYQFLASRGLYQKPVILNIISYFKLLDNYHESSALYRLLNLPFLKIAVEDIVKISQYANQKAKSFYEALLESNLIKGISQQGAEQSQRLLALIKKHSKMAQEKKISEVLAAFLRDSGYLEYLTSSENDCQIELLNKFYQKIKDFEDEAVDPSLTNFMAVFNLELESGESGQLGLDLSQDPDSIKVMTVHSAKGLEFKYVFLVSMVDKRFPSIERKEPIEVPAKLIKDIKPEGDMHLQEEHRLCYVALTRAKRGLFFTSADDYGGKSKKKLSRFLLEMGFKSKEPSAFKLLKEFDSRQEEYQKELKRGKNESALIAPASFSFSQLKPFEICPLKYKYARVLKNFFGNKAVFSFGRTIHLTLYQFIKRKEEKAEISQKSLFSAEKTAEKTAGQDEKKKKELLPSLDELLEIYSQKWIDDWYETKEQKQGYKKLGRKILKTFYDSFVKNPPQIAKIKDQLCLEIGFNFKIGGWSFNGKIDRIDQLKEGVRIIDYKTGKTPEKLRKEDKEQLLIYQIAAEEAFGLEVKELNYYYLEENKIISFLGSQREKEGLKEKIKEQITALRETDFKASPGFHCQFCDFRSICQFAL